MENEEHKFGIGDYLSADDYKVDEIITIKVVDFLGRQKYTARDNKEKMAGMYKIELPSMGVRQEFRLGIKNEKLVAKKYGIKSYEELVGRQLSLKVKSFQIANGFVVVGVK